MRDDLTVILVSNRGPVSFVETDEGFERKRGAGGLAGAVDPVARRLGDRATWICATTSDTDRRAVRAGTVVQDASADLGYRLELVDIDEKTYARYYDVVSNRMLWFANHCLWEELDVHEFGEAEIAAWEDAYEPVNRRFARAAAEAADPGSLVLFQDYHLSTAPRHLRQMHPDQTILHFTHSSFCGPEGLAPLPGALARDVVEGMLGADLVGFHVHHWANGFMDCCEHLGATVDRGGGMVEYKGRTSWVRTYPIPIDPSSLRARAAGAEARSWRDRFARLRPRNGRLIVRADRTEPSKNIIRGFQAWGALLDRRPDLARSACFVACLYPSRESMTEYRRYGENVRLAVDAVNTRHPGAIQLFLQDDFDRTLAALTEYDVLLVNPIMDGMNLVSKEGPCINERAGALVLSTGAGSFEELGEWAVAVDDPLNVEETAGALEAALEMDEAERTRRAVALSGIVQARKPSDWIGPQLDDLIAVRDGGKPANPYL